MARSSTVRTTGRLCVRAGGRAELVDEGGPIVAGGMLFFNSGYGGFVGNPGNVLLAFGID